jgi:uncharacterized membrane protein HdeD (DUF308 family)
MQSVLTGNWWAFLLRGIAAVLFGLAALFPWPLRNEPAFVIVVYFGGYALVDGILALVAGIRGSVSRLWPLLVEGLLGVLAGFISFFEPVLEVPNFYLYVIAAWAILTGILEGAMAISLRRARERDPSFLMGFSGVLSMFFGLLVAAAASGGVDSYVYPLVVLYGPSFGIALIRLGVRVRGPRQGSGRIG